MTEVPDTIDVVLDGLTTPTTDEIVFASDAFSVRDLASSAASRAMSGAGGFDPVTVLLECSGLDLHDLGSHPLKWTGAFNNGYDYTPIVALPAGIGLTVAFDGSSETMTTTTAGTWALTLTVNIPGDETWAGYAQAENNFPAQTTMAPLADANHLLTVGGVCTYPLGATVAPIVATTTQATADPLTAQPFELLIVRLA